MRQQLPFTARSHPPWRPERERFGCESAPSARCPFPGGRLRPRQRGGVDADSLISSSKQGTQGTGPADSTPRSGAVAEHQPVVTLGQECSRHRSDGSQCQRLRDDVGQLQRLPHPYHHHPARHPQQTGQRTLHHRLRPHRQPGDGKPLCPDAHCRRPAWHDRHLLEQRAAERYPCSHPAHHRTAESEQWRCHGICPRCTTGAFLCPL